MLDGAFTFRGRIGRLQFFGNGLLMLPAAGVAAVALAMLYPGSRDGTRLAAIVACLGVVGVAFLWFSLSLHVRRIRDIGWDPVAAIGGWIAGNAADAVLAALVPHWALAGGHHGTALGALGNCALSLALFLWPGHDGPVGPDVPLPGRAPDVSLPPVPSPALPMSVRGRKGFGRRGVA